MPNSAPVVKGSRPQPRRQAPTPNYADQIAKIQARKQRKDRLGSQTTAPSSSKLTPTDAERKKAARRRRRLAQPMFPGGITTRGEFIKGERAAENAQFRPQEQQVSEAANQIPAWYQDYLAKLQGLQQQTVEQYQGLQGQAGSLNESVQGTPGSETATAAADARNNLVKAIQGSLIQQQGAQLGKLGQYGAIATARKSQKEDEITKARKEIATQRGEFRAKYQVEGKQREFENALAASQFGLKQQQTAAEIAAGKKKEETTYDKEFSKQAAKFGYSPHDWRLLGSKGRAKAIAEAQRKSGTKPESLARIQKKEEIKIAAKNGYTPEQWRKLSPQQRAAIIRKENKSADKEKGTELTFRTGEQRGKAAGEAASAQGIINSLRTGQGIKGTNAKGHKRSRSEAAKIILADPKAPEPVVVSAALDAEYVGFISRNTAKRLHAAGFKVEEIAQALGVPTFSQWSKKNQTPGNRQSRPT